MNFKFKVFGLEIGVLNTFKIKSDEHKVCTSHENTHFLFWLLFHLTYWW
jgi:hypothetical protein